LNPSGFSFPQLEQMTTIHSLGRRAAPH